MRNEVLFIFVTLVTCFSTTHCGTYQCNLNSSCGCSIPQTILSARIIGGEEAPDHAWKWLVSLQYNGKHRCGASLIKENYLVTAAHCVDDVKTNPGGLSILAGTNYLSSASNTGTQRRTIEQFWIHPNYNSRTFENDIAILKFAPLTISSEANTAFVCLPNHQNDPFLNNDNLVVAGWGVTVFGTTTPSNTLLQATMKAFASNDPACVRSQIINPYSQLCAGVIEGGKDSCQGDSGGPLMAFSNSRWVLVGITSSGFECALPGFLGVYTRISYFIPFITNIVSDVNIAPEVAPPTTVVTPRAPSASSTMSKSALCSLILLFFSILDFVRLSS